jgi:protein-tyrosine-phosphatase
MHLLTSTVRSFIAQAYLEYLRNRHPTLQNAISIIDSAGLEVDFQPSARPLQGVKTFLAEKGISASFDHVPKKFQYQQFETFTYILTLNQREIGDVAWKTKNPLPFHLGLRLLGSFGNKSGKDTDVREPERISDREWSVVEKAMVYSGYEKCFSDVKEHMLRFILSAFEFDVMIADYL